jgi:hypothetical protein
MTDDHRGPPAPGHVKDARLMIHSTRGRVGEEYDGPAKYDSIHLHLGNEGWKSLYSTKLNPGTYSTPLQCAV